jgi:branched-chain amino acid transport system ATP-binding protein
MAHQDMVPIAPGSVSQRCYVMGHGHMVFEGSPEDLRSRTDIRKEWLEV